MNNQNPDRFRLLLGKAVREIAYFENKTIRIVQDELGHTLGRANGSCIDYWRRGNIPASMLDLETLVKTLVNRRGLSIDQAGEILQSAEPFYTQARVNALLSATHFKPTKRDLPAPHSPLSPFVVGPPITRPSQFFGRDSELKRIFGWWRFYPLQNVAIVGKKRSGKTSLLHYLHQITQTPEKSLRSGQRNNWLPDQEQYRWILVDFQDPRMTRLERLLAHILVGLKLEVPSPCTLEAFMDVVNGRINHPTVILMDELVAALESPELDTSFWWALRALVSHGSQGKLAFVVSAHDFPMSMAEDQGKPSPFFNLFNTLELGPLTETAARALIASSPVPFPEKNSDWIIAESQCWPALVQILCQVYFDWQQGRLAMNNWQQEGLNQIKRFNYLLTNHSN